MIKRVEGLGLDGSTVNIMLGKIEVPMISASYGDKLDVGELGYMGGQQIDELTQGKYSTDEITFEVSDVIYRSLILPNMPSRGMGVIRIPSIIINKEHPDLGSDSDQLSGCRLIGWPMQINNTQEAFKLSLKAKCRQVLWGSERKTINLLRGEQLGVSSF
ncbi:MAG: hypothetical protein RIF41_37060 [Polyangiaceae bacterium]